MRKSRRIAAALALSATLTTGAPAFAATGREDAGKAIRPNLIAWLVELFAPVTDPTPTPPEPVTQTPPPGGGQDFGPNSDPDG